MRLLYFAPLSFGGLADYARDQAGALAEAGVALDLLCAPSFPRVPADGIRRHDRLPGERPDRDRPGRLARARRFLSTTVRRYRELAAMVRAGGFRHVLLGSYAEYFAPLWSPALRRLAREGVVFGAVVHDPVRDAVLGPAWWHRRSVADGYSFLRHAFVHESIRLDTGRRFPDLAVTVIPHGPYHFDTEVPPRVVARNRLGLLEDRPVLLAFGHIRDNKNLHLTIEALKALPPLHLLVAGNELSSGQRPAGDYQRLARLHGVEQRCHWHVRFVPEAEIGMFFSAADFVSLTYSGGFRSASGVLNVASQFRKPCIASGGPGPLRTLVGRHDLGVWVEPDNLENLVTGLRRLLARPLHPRWDDYLRENSWEENARIVSHALFQTP